MDLSNKTKHETIPWIEKYRPSTLDDVISQSDIVDTLKNFINNKKLPHLLFYGPPGTGKTSVITACAKELYGRNFDMMVIEINASEERGIDIVRNRITKFAATRSILFDDSMREMFKLVILDEADAMTMDAQASLRRIIEKYTYNVRFCLICNYIKKINVAVQSRCICFRFGPLKYDSIVKKVTDIVTQEKIKINSDGINTIIKRARGDMRKVLNVLQSTHMAYAGKLITSEIVDTCISYPSNTKIMDLVNSLFLKSFTDSYLLLKQYNDDGYALSDIIFELHSLLISYLIGSLELDFNIPVEKIRSIIEFLQNAEHNLINSTSDTIHVGEIIGAFHNTHKDMVIKN